MTSLSRLQTFYGGLETSALLRVMIKEEFAGKIALFSSFGADSALLIALVAEIDPSVPILFLETGKHFKETLEYLKHLESLCGLTDVRLLKPQEELLHRIDPDATLWNKQPNRCCWIRKVEPLERHLNEEGFEAVITGRKSYQTSDRSNLETIELYEDGRFRINPLANWSKAELKGEFSRRRLPQHPLVAEGYLSIGCEPCTAKVAPGQDERAGRWAHTRGDENIQKAECGIHLQDNETPDWEV